MGPAEPVRDRLAKIYDPLGGYLWLTSQLLAFLAAGFFAIALFLCGGMLGRCSGTDCCTGGEGGGGSPLPPLAFSHLPLIGGVGLSPPNPRLPPLGFGGDPK